VSQSVRYEIQESFMFCFLHTTEMFIDTLYGWYLWFECILAYLIVFCEMHSLLTVE
jgi:hypothetical protein